MPIDLKLRIGDVSDNGQVTIVDEDRLCYIVRSESRGATGLRTISKALLKEFVTYISEHPRVPANEVRYKLSGLSDIDKYEYGYGATLAVMAQMVLDRGGLVESHDVVLPRSDQPLQQIFYGAPGTGKSYAIKELTKGKKVIRTTFHPDSDYSTFVGCYKPTTKEVPVISNFGGKAIRVKDENGEEIHEERIVYEFVEQAFLQAYIKAWKQYARAEEGKTPEEVYLVIEEINRGNCAQIFGDLFQLLDRGKDGFSEYPIMADKDMQKQLAKAFADMPFLNAPAMGGMSADKVAVKIRNGEILLLPNNLYIWATMNTSDQSLFPIDSAFKRRWDWQYVPIANAGKGWILKVNGKQYDWWDFLEKINALIGETTNSEDKKLGYFFCKTTDGIINADTFVSKVIFYLWNDVFKDFEFEGDVFIDDDKESKLTFDKFYRTDSNGKPAVRESKVDLFLSNLGVRYVDYEINNDEIVNEEMLDSIEGSPSSNPPSSGRSAVQRFYVIFPDGTVIEENTQFETYTKTLERIGLDRAESIAAEKRYTRKRCALIDRIQRDEILNSSGFSYVTINGFHIVKGILVNTMVDVLNNISEILNLGLDVKLTRE